MKAMGANSRVVVVGGGGHVGLPLALVLSDSGFTTTSYDISSSTVELVASGRMPFIENGAEDLLRKHLANGNFNISSDAKCIENADVVVVVIGTPVDEHLSPDPNSVIQAVRNILPFMNEKQLLILRSTIYPGVFFKLKSVVNESFPKMEIAYCPERIVEGQAIDELRKLPQIIGSDSDSAFTRASEIFKNLGVSTFRSSPGEAELAKLFTNVWRYIKFSAANQFWMMSSDLGIDYERVRTAIAFEYPRASDLPHAGFTAGPCLFKDTMQLSALVQQNFPLGHSAMMVNEGTPGFLVSQMEKKYELSKMRVGILGMAFKANVDDVRSSLAFKLKKILEFKCLEVSMTDPYVKDDRFIDLENLLATSDILIIGAPHEDYRYLQTSKPVIDIWGMFGREALI